MEVRAEFYAGIGFPREANTKNIIENGLRP
jgi:hypothetical protein